MKNFKIVKNTYKIVNGNSVDLRPLDDYRLIGMTETNEDLKPKWDENKWADEIDSFKDGYEPICEDENGELYLVEFDWETKEPMIWQRVEEI